MPEFDAEALHATLAVDDVFAEHFTLTPYAPAADVNAPETPDATRQAARLRGVWREKRADPKEPNAYDPRSYRRPGEISDTPTVEFAASAFRHLPGFAVRDGDQIERCSTQTVYRAMTPTVSANGTVRVPVNYLGAP